jgi:sec-independent protein translocase protein TatC
MSAEDSPATTDGTAPGANPRKLRLPRSRRVVNPDARMPLMEHIRELRNRLIKAVLAVTAGSVAGWYLRHQILAFIQRPYCKLPPRIVNPLHVHAVHGAHCTLFTQGLFDPLFFQLKLAIAFGVIASAPIWMYQIWAFIVPGLHVRERRWTYLFIGAAVPLFAGGSVIAYFAMTKGLRFLLGLTPGGITVLPSINSYLSYAMAMLLIFGLSFEVPLVMVLLNLAGVLTHKRFAKWRRMIIFLIFAFAAVATPSPDPFSMLLLAVPCVLLVEAAEVFVWVNDRRRLRRGIVYPGLSPEEVTEYGLDTEPVSTADLDDVEAGR